MGVWLVSSASKWKWELKNTDSEVVHGKLSVLLPTAISKLEFTQRVNCVALSKSLGTPPDLSFLPCKMGISPSALPSDQVIRKAK